MNPDKILAVDTATEACSAALLSGGQFYCRFEVAPRRHNLLIFEMCRDILSEAAVDISELKALVFGRGPGSFTGVRIATSLVQGIAYGRAIPVVPISDLQAVAQQAFEHSGCHQIFVAMDARMEEVYYGYFQKGADDLVEATSEEGVLPPQQLPVLNTFNGVGAGTAWTSYQKIIRAIFGERLTDWHGPALPEAETLLKLALPRIAAGDTISVVSALPTYLRNKVVKKSNSSK